MTKATLLTIVSAACLGATIVSPCLPNLANYFNVNNNQIGMLISIYLFGYLFGQFFYAILSNRYGYSFSLKTGFAIYSLSACLQLISIKYLIFYLLDVSRFFCAFGASAGLVCTFAMINEFSDKRTSQKLLSLAFISLTLFSYLSITIGGAITQFLGWKAVFITQLLIAFFQLLMVFIFIPKSRTKLICTPSNNTIFLKNYLISLFNIRLFLLSIIVAFTTTSTYLYAATVPSIAYNVFFLTPSTFGLFSILNLVGLLSGGIFFSYLSKNYNTLNILLCGISVTSLPLSMFLIFHGMIFNTGSTPLFFFILTTIINFGLGLIYPSSSYLALNSISCNTTASSIMNMIKIGCPITVITLVSNSEFSLINSFKIPLSIYCLIAFISLLLIKIHLKFLYTNGVACSLEC